MTKVLMICNRPDEYGRIPGHWVKGVDRQGSVRTVFVPLLLLKLGHDCAETVYDLWGLEMDSHDRGDLDLSDLPYGFAHGVGLDKFRLDYDYLGWI